MFIYKFSIYIYIKLKELFFNNSFFQPNLMGTHEQKCPWLQRLQNLRENFKEQAICAKGENAYSYCKLSDVTNS